jgi:tetratricopeptide (TPR) repeat protein
LGDKHPDIALSLNNLSHTLREQGRYDEAASVLQEALGIARPALGDEHPLTATYMVNLARIQLLQGQAATAEPLLRHALGIRLRAFREDDWRIASAKSLLGAILTALGRYGEAEPLLLDAQRVLKDIPGPQGREARATRERLVALKEARDRERAAAARR